MPTRRIRRTALLLLVLAACGREGPQGPAGPQGATGPQGPGVVKAILPATQSGVSLSATTYNAFFCQTSPYVAGTGEWAALELSVTCTVPAGGLLAAAAAYNDGSMETFAGNDAWGGNGAAYAMPVSVSPLGTLPLTAGTSYVFEGYAHVGNGTGPCSCDLVATVWTP